jgi:hypothetical protein
MIVASMNINFRAKVDNALKNMNKLNNSVSKLGKIAKVASVAIAGYAIGNMTKQLTEATAKTQQWASILGISASKLEAINNVGAKYNITADRLNDAIKDLNERVADGATGTKTYEEAFNRLGLKSKELIKLPVEEQFYAVATALSQLNTQAEKNFVSAELMADAGFELVYMADSLGGSLKSVVEETQNMSSSLTDLDISNLAKVDYVFNSIGITLKKVFGKVIASIAPQIEFIANEFNNLFSSQEGVQLLVDSVKDLAVVLIPLYKIGKLVFGILKVGIMICMQLGNVIGGLLSKALQVILYPLKLFGITWSDTMGQLADDYGNMFKRLTKEINESGKAMADILTGQDIAGKIQQSLKSMPKVTKMDIDAKTGLSTNSVLQEIEAKKKLKAQQDIINKAEAKRLETIKKQNEEIKSQVDNIKKAITTEIEGSVAKLNEAKKLAETRKIGIDDYKKFKDTLRAGLSFSGVSLDELITPAEKLEKAFLKIDEALKGGLINTLEAGKIKKLLKEQLTPAKKDGIFTFADQIREQFKNNITPEEEFKKFENKLSESVKMGLITRNEAEFAYWQKKLELFPDKFALRKELVDTFKSPIEKFRERLIAVKEVAPDLLDKEANRLMEATKQQATQIQKTAPTLGRAFDVKNVNIASLATQETTDEKALMELKEMVKILNDIKKKDNVARLGE